MREKKKERPPFVHNIWRPGDIKFSNCKIDAAYVTLLRDASLPWVSEGLTATGG